MELTAVRSYNELIELLDAKKRSYILLYKAGMDTSECSRRNIRLAGENLVDIAFFEANVNEVRDIHLHYGVTSVPTLLEFEGSQFKNIIKGCQEPAFYKSYFENIIYELKAGKDDKPSKRVTVYTTPTCPWCTTLKTYLRKQGIRFSEVNVASDESAARDMVSKSGQQGVPQTEIDGEMVIGFDQPKLKQLLEIKSN